MSKAVIGKWLQKDTRQTQAEHFERLGFEIEFEGQLFSEYQNLLKAHTIQMKGGASKFNEEAFTHDLIAKTIKKADGEEINLLDKATLDEFGVTNIKDALDKMFTVGEIQRVANIAKELAGLNEQDEKEIADLKN